MPVKSTEVRIEAPPDKIRKLAELQRSVALAKAEIAAAWTTAGKLAKAIDETTVQTPALQVLDDALRDVEEGRCDRLIISMPPQEGKSTRATIYGTLQALRKHPDWRCGIVSYSQDIAGDFSYQIRSLIQTFDGTDGELDLGLRLRQDNRAMSRWYLDKTIVVDQLTGQTSFRKATGSLRAVGIGSSLTGRPLDYLVIDDPVKDYRAADSLLLSEAAWTWWMSVARPRLAPGAPVIVILTRWHELDLAGRLLAKQKLDEEAGEKNYDHWRVVNIPAQADHKPELGEVDVLGREPGEFMVSARGRTTAQWLAAKTATIARIWAALFQGKPSPDTGNVLQRGWWRRYEGLPPETATDWLTSWDMTFKDTKGSDYVVGQVWCKDGGEVYLVDQVRGRWDFVETCAQVKSLAKRYPQAHLHLVEDKANGPAVISALRRSLPGMVPVEVKDSKYARTTAVSPFVESGNVLIPKSGAWVDDFVEECAIFDNGAHDDQVDAFSQAVHRLLGHANDVAAWRKLFARQNGKELPPDEFEVPDDAAELDASFEVEEPDTVGPVVEDLAEIPAAATVDPHTRTEVPAPGRIRTPPPDLPGAARRPRRRVR